MAEGAAVQGASGGWYPNTHWKRVSGVAEQIREFWVISAPVRNFNQSPGLLLQKANKNFPNSWFTLSHCPFDWEWYPEVGLMFIPKWSETSPHPWCELRTSVWDYVFCDYKVMKYVCIQGHGGVKCVRQKLEWDKTNTTEKKIKNVEDGGIFIWRW